MGRCRSRAPPGLAALGLAAGRGRAAPPLIPLGDPPSGSRCRACHYYGDGGCDAVPRIRPRRRGAPALSTDLLAIVRGGRPPFGVSGIFLLILVPESHAARGPLRGWGGRFRCGTATADTPGGARRRRFPGGPTRSGGPQPATGARALLRRSAASVRRRGRFRAPPAVRTGRRHPFCRRGRRRRRSMPNGALHLHLRRQRQAVFARLAIGDVEYRGSTTTGFRPGSSQPYRQYPSAGRRLQAFRRQTRWSEMHGGAHRSRSAGSRVRPA